MASQSVYSLLKTALAASALFVLSACGNPFAGRSESSKIPKNEFHTRTENCNRINFNEEHLSDSQLRAVFGCLNSNHEIEALDVLIQSLSEKQLNPLVELVNQTTDLNPTVFYAGKEMYNRLRNDGRLTEIEKLTEKLLANSDANTAVASALKAWAPVLRELIQTQSVSISTAALDAMASSKSFQRFVRENHQPEKIRKFAASAKNYLTDPTAVSAQGLYQILAENRVAESFQTISADPKKLEKLASFLEWIFSENRFEAFSTSLDLIRSEKISCFDGKIAIENPLKTGLARLARMNTTESKTYFEHDLKNLVLVSRGYCEIPYSIDGLLKFLSDSTNQPGYEQIFHLLQPLITDDRFISFLASAPARTWMKENAHLAENHFFQDLLTLIAQSQRQSISKNGATIAHILDESLRAMSAKNLENLISFLGPAVSAEEKFGYHGIHLLHSVISEFPDLKPHSQTNLRTQLGSLTQTLLQHEKIAGVMTLTASLIQSEKLNSIIDQTLVIFENFLNRGKTKLTFDSLKSIKHSSADLVNWLLNKVEPVVPSLALQNCEQMTLNWNFSEFNRASSSAYFTQMDLITACLNTNQTFKKAKDLAIYLSSIQQFSFVLQTQKSVISRAFQLDQQLAFDTLDSFLDLERKQSEMIRQTLKISSDASKTLVPILKKKEIRSLISDQLSKPLIYQTVAEYLRSATSVPKEVPSLDLAALRQITVQIDREQTLINEPFASALTQLFKTYCPGLNPDSPTCDIDDDQVEIYKKSPAALVVQIKAEFMKSTQTWSHPNQFKGWRHTHQKPTRVSDFEYHLNPMLHLVRNGASSIDSVFAAVARIQGHRYDLYRFLKDRALRLTLIPYIYQVPNYPANSAREFHERVRIRIVSDLDRLELLATNADFKAFGLIQNMGMGFIREIGLSWGDLPPDQWPKSLQALKDPQNVRTLKEARDYIHGEMARFDRGIIQKMGDCDPRGKSAARRWIQRRICSNEVFDISSRLFNLRFLITLLDREVIETENSSGGLALLRDLFYSLYEANHLNQFDQFGNGVDAPQECLMSPSLSAEPNSVCNKDILTLIPKITRLGLLHQVGMSILKNEQTASRSLVNTVNKLSKQTAITENLSNFLSTVEGIQTFESGVDFGFKSGEKTSSALEALLPMADLIPNQNWISAVVDLVRQYPQLLKDHGSVVEAVLSSDGSTLGNITQSIVSNPNAKAFAWMNDFTMQLKPALITELATSMREIKDQAPALATSINAFYQSPSIDSPKLTRVLSRWTEVIGSASGTATRKQIAAWVKSPDYEQFCDVFSDSTFVDKTYNFLDEVHQNTDSRAFFDSCKAFMNLR